MKILLIATNLILLSSASLIREVRVKTAGCSDCGMTPFFGHLSAKVFKINYQSLISRKNFKIS